MEGYFSDVNKVKAVQYMCTTAENRNADGTATCWGGKWYDQADTSAAISSSNTASFKTWLWMASPNADFTNGYRFFKGQTVMTAYFERQTVNAAWYESPVTFAGAYTTLASTAALVAGALFTLF